jgi:SAM-dependent methyltransferase
MMASLVETKPGSLEVHVDQVLSLPAPPEAPEPGAWCAYFEELYREAGGDVTRVPWAEGRCCPEFLAWLNGEAPSLVRPGATACVVGCGLGDDARELADRGYDVIGFDVSPTAIQWARSRHPEISDRLVVADIFRLPVSLLRRADLVVEVNTIQSVHPSLRPSVAAGIAALARPRGTVLTVCRARDEGEPMPDGPPYPLSVRELMELMAAQGFMPMRPMDDFVDDQIPPVHHLRASFKRGC